MHGDYGRGITIRDYFAAAALTGQLSTEQGYNAASQKIAAWSYQIADAMLAARKEGA
jgi:hypothetical protein